MIAARPARTIFDNYDFGFKYEDIIEAIDWNRVLFQAYGEHAKVHSTEPNPICGACIKSVLLRTEE